MIDENKFAPKLGMTLQSSRSPMHSQSFKRKTNIANNKNEITFRSLLTCDDVSRILNLNYKSCEKIKSMISEAKECLDSASFTCSNEVVEADRKDLECKALKLLENRKLKKT